MAPAPLQVWCDAFPVVSETFVVNEVLALAELGHAVEVVAGGRPGASAAASGTVRYLEDESSRERARAMVLLAARHPLGVLADLRDRRRWRREEEVPPLRWLAPAALRLERSPDVHVHVHFAGGMALGALRVHRLLGRPWSLTAHAWDIYLRPANLREKLRAAAVVTSGCDYTVRDLRRISGREDVHRIVMGVDPERFARRRPVPERGPVVAIGRLVEKKGFVHLVRAAALLPRGARVVLVGDGPLRAELPAEVERLGLGDVVTLLGEQDPAAIRALLEDAAVLAMPCVVAADGDRDSMPVVVKEALAMEVPVVVSDAVGLPELARPAFARLVPPGDPAALAAALTELLGLPAAERAAMGRAGRAFVAEHADVRQETARLSALLAAAAPYPRPAHDEEEPCA